MKNTPSARRLQLDQNTDKSNGPDGCWLWTGQKNAGGYGVLRSGELAHRESWKQNHNEALVAYEFVCHRCDVRACVNPAHLYLGSPKMNAADAKRRGRLFIAPRNNHRTVEAIQRRQVRRDEWEDANEPTKFDLVGLR